MNRLKKELRKKAAAEAEQARQIEHDARRIRREAEERTRHRSIVSEQREARAQRRKRWLAAKRPVIPPPLDNPTFRAWIEEPRTRQMWIAVGTRLLIADFPQVIRGTPESDNVAIERHDECLICAEMWPADGSYAAKHVADHAIEWLTRYGYVLPDRYENADVLADALAVAFSRLGG